MTRPDSQWLSLPLFDGTYIRVNFARCGVLRTHEQNPKWATIHIDGEQFDIALTCAQIIKQVYLSTPNTGLG